MYAGALAVVYPPFDEDFGYVTLEAFLARKPVVTVPIPADRNEFVVDGVNGFVSAPSRALGVSHQRLAADRRRAAAMGDAGHEVAPRHHLGRRHRKIGLRVATSARIATARETHHPDPCLNEAATLPATLADLPRAMPGIDIIEVLVVDDGSRDGTADVARACGVEQSSGSAGTRGSRPRSWPASTRHSRPAPTSSSTPTPTTSSRRTRSRSCSQPLLSGEADIVIGDRNIAELRHMSWRKRQLQRLGSWVVRQVSNTTVPDTTSGFRAYTREAALRMTIVSEFSYTLESIIQAGKKRMAIAHVSVATNPRTRESRLFDSVFWYIKRSAATIVRIYAMYEPLKVFTYLGLAVLGIGVAISVRFLFYYFTEAASDRPPPVADRVRRPDDRGLPGDRHRPARRHDLGQPETARRRAVQGAQAGAAPGAVAPGTTPVHGSAQTRSVGPLRWPTHQPSQWSFPPSTKPPAIAEVVTRSPPPGLARDHRRRRRFERCNGGACGGRWRGGRQAPVQQGQRRRGQERDRRASGEFVMIIDGDGQHRPEDARRIVSRLGEYDLVVGARVEPRRRPRGGLGNAALNGLASYLTGRHIPDLTSGFRGAAQRVPA